MMERMATHQSDAFLSNGVWLLTDYALSGHDFTIVRGNGGSKMPEIQSAARPATIHRVLRVLRLGL